MSTCMLGGDFRSYCHVISVAHALHILCFDCYTTSFHVKHACLPSLYHIPSAMSININAYSYPCTYMTNANMQVKRHIIFDDVFIYHAHTFFVMSRACVGNFARVSTTTHHELTIQALESELRMVPIDTLPRHICFGHDIMKDAQGQAFKC